MPAQKENRLQVGSPACQRGNLVNGRRSNVLSGPARRPWGVFPQIGCKDLHNRAVIVFRATGDALQGIDPSETDIELPAS